MVLGLAQSSAAFPGLERSWTLKFIPQTSSLIAFSQHIVLHPHPWHGLRLAREHTRMGVLGRLWVNLPLQQQAVCDG